MWRRSWSVMQCGLTWDQAMSIFIWLQRTGAPSLSLQKIINLALNLYLCSTNWIHASDIDSV